MVNKEATDETIPPDFPGSLDLDGLQRRQTSTEEARAYLMKTLGDNGGYRTHEIDRYIVVPAQAAGYKMGMLEILRLRQLAQEQLGVDFNLIDFHHVVLSNGSVPLNLLDELVNTYVVAKKP